MPLDLLNVDGPMARDVRDLALLLDAMAGFCAADPWSFEQRGVSFQAAAATPLLPRRIVAVPEMDGVAPDPEVAAVFDAAIARIAAAGVEVEPAAPDFAGIADAAYALRLGMVRARTSAAELRRISPHLSPIALRTYEDALRLDLDDYLAGAERQQRLVADVAHALDDDVLIVTPAVAHAPRRHRRASPPHQPTPEHHWARDAVFAYAVTLSLCPALVLPAGLSPDGLPVGVQIVGPPRGEARLLSAGRALEEALAFPVRLPIDPVTTFPSTHDKEPEAGS